MVFQNQVDNVEGTTVDLNIRGSAMGASHAICLSSSNQKPCADEIKWARTMNRMEIAMSMEYMDILREGEGYSGTECSHEILESIFGFCCSAWGPTYSSV